LGVSYLRDRRARATLAAASVALMIGAGEPGPALAEKASQRALARGSRVVIARRHRGHRGRRGLPGLPGAPGSQGFPGPGGFSGTRGPPGGVGPAGPAGPRGATGRSGPTGATGATGPANTTPGPTGPSGAHGATGARGASGPAGSLGATGPSGPEGQQSFDFAAAAGTPASGEFVPVFNHGGLELLANCTSSSELQLRAYNSGANNALIKVFDSFGSQRTTFDSNASGNPVTTGYSTTTSGQSANHSRYTEDDQFSSGEIFDFNPHPSTSFPFKITGPQDAQGTLVFVDDTSSAVAVNYLAHSRGFKSIVPGGSPSDEAPFTTGSGTACVFAGHALYPPGT